MADDDDDGSAALAAMRERLAALTQPAAGGMGQALEVAAMQDALATKLVVAQARIDALMAGPSESDCRRRRTTRCWSGSAKSPR